jgi:hypothetical protein
MVRVSSRLFSIALAALALSACVDAEDGDDVTLGEAEQSLVSEGCTTIGETACRGELSINVGGATYSAYYYRNFALGSPPSGITNAMIVLHGVDRNAWEYFGSGLAAARYRDRLSSTIVVAPLFPTPAKAS